MSKSQQRLISALAHCPLFSMVSEEVLLKIPMSKHASVRTFSSGEEIPLSVNGSRALVILTGGLALVYSADTARSVILRAIRPGTPFGVSVLFSDEAPVSVIRAKGKAEALYLSLDAVLELIESNAEFRMNYMRFLSDRIRFLNRRIACYTAGSAERRLALYLSDLETDASGIAHIDIPLSDLCEQLDIGRASLYRAFGKLCEAGLIERTDRTVRITDPSALLCYDA